MTKHDEFKIKDGVSPIGSGTQQVYRFPNNFGASVVRNEYSYGGPTLFELAVIEFDDDGEWSITYETKITSDVMGYLTAADVEETLNQIKELV